MPSPIDRVGAFRGKIRESGVGASKGGFPQFVVNIVATQMWIDDPSQFAEFGLTEAGWADWSAYDMDITGFLLLAYNDKQTQAPVLGFHVEGIQRATGWNGASFASLGTTPLTDKEITFWTEENEWNGVVRLQVAAIDAADASPSRSLRTLDGDGLKNLDSKFANLLVGKAPPVTAAKAPAKAAPGKAPAAKPAAAPTKAAAPTAATPPTAASPAKPASPSKAPPKKAPAPAAPVAEAPFEGSLTMDQAWEQVNKSCPKQSDDSKAEAWVTASDEVAPGGDEATITGEQWAQIATKAVAALNDVAV